MNPYGFRPQGTINRVGLVPVNYMDRRLRSRLMAWWYFAISAGFVLLGFSSWMVRGPLRFVILRFAIAVGFLMLGLLTWNSKRF